MQVVCCIFLQTIAAQNYQTSNEVKIECSLLDNHDLLVQESIRRNSFLHKLQVYGPIVRLSHLPSNDSICGGHVVVIEIFATDKIIIDDDYNSLGDDITFIVAAPTIEVIDERKINLRGRDGGSHERQNAYNGNPNGNRNGNNGLAGLPGGPGSHFFGIAQNVINFDHLTVRVQGGNGGPGQNGGHGTSGITGTTFDLSKEKIHRNGDIDGHNVILRRLIHPPASESYLGNGTQEVALGVKGTNGGDGGNGGVGGKGGYPGVYAFLDLKVQKCEKKEIFRDVSPGRSGRDGKGGRGGIAGYPGSDVILELYFTQGDDVLIKNKEYHEQQELLDGQNGLNGMSTKGERKPQEHPHWQNFPYTIDRFNAFLKTNVHMSTNIDMLHKVIENNNRILNNVQCLLIEDIESMYKTE